jgi:hypothetical protein
VDLLLELRKAIRKERHNNVNVCVLLVTTSTNLYNLSTICVGATDVLTLMQMAFLVVESKEKAKHGSNKA